MTKSSMDNSPSPNDMRVAKQIVNRIVEEPYNDFERLELDIAQALADQREKDAVIAENLIPYPTDQEDIHTGTCIKIAKAIREQK